MKCTNLISIVQAFKTLSSDMFESYLKYNSATLKESELKDLVVFCRHLKLFSKQVEIFDKYYLGYRIPQISAEFDLLRFSDDLVINIELKRKSSEERILEQLRRNKYYLSFLGKRLLFFTYVSSTKKLFHLTDQDELVELEMSRLVDELTQQEASAQKSVDDLFNPSNYLVSPFNSTEKFIQGNYFLTNQQAEIKKAVIKEIQTETYTILAIKGKAGTGKTLLTYDIAKELNESINVLIVHSGMINNGHHLLKGKYGWNIIPASEFDYQDLSNYQLVIVDEAQRFFFNQFNRLTKHIKETSSNCILSYDPVQVLRSGEKTSQFIEDRLTVDTFELTDKIRTNKEVARFIKCLFDNKEGIHSLNYSNVELNYFEDSATAKKIMRQLQGEDWTVINYTPSAVSFPYLSHQLEGDLENAHSAIGQDFDNVIAVIDEYFCYDANGKLSICGYKSQPYYQPTKMLFQIVSRTKIKLRVIIINNPLILQRCLAILERSSAG